MFTSRSTTDEVYEAMDATHQCEIYSDSDISKYDFIGWDCSEDEGDITDMPSDVE